MIQLIVKENKLYNELKSYALYSSDITNVLELNEAILPFNLKYRLDSYIKSTEYIKETETSSSNSPRVVILNNKVFIENSTKELDIYLNLSFPEREVKLDYLENLFFLVTLNIIKPTKSWIDFFYTKPLDNSSLVDRFLVSNYNVIYKSKRFNLKDNSKERNIIKILQNDRKISNKTYYVIKDKQIKAIDHGTIILDDGYSITYSTPNLPFNLKNRLAVGDIISFITDTRSKVVYDAEICPSNLPDKFVKEVLTTNKRDIPIRLLRVLYTEYNYINNLHNGDNDEFSNKVQTKIL